MTKCDEITPFLFGYLFSFTIFFKLSSNLETLNKTYKQKQ